MSQEQTIKEALGLQNIDDEKFLTCISFGILLGISAGKSIVLSNSPIDYLEQTSERMLSMVEQKIPGSHRHLTTDECKALIAWFGIFQTHFADFINVK